MIQIWNIVNDAKPKTMSTIGSTKTMLIALALCLGTTAGSAQDAEQLFSTNCKTCHKLGKRLVGPDLLGVNDRRSEEWLVSFIQSSQTMIKAGDAEAVEVYTKFNEVLMPDQTAVNEAQIKEILGWIKSKSPNAAGTAEVVEEEPVEPIEFTQEDIDLGTLLYSGKKLLANNGPSCVSCHNVNYNGMIPGGLLAKDLTNVHGRMGEAGVMGILGAPPFPAMASAYEGKELTEDEVRQLAGFLKHADSVSDEQDEATSGTMILGLGGGLGLLAILIIIGLTWQSRLRRHSKADIYERQLKSV